MKYETPELKIEVFELADDIAALSGIGGGGSETTTGGGGSIGDDKTTTCTCGPVLEEDDPFYERINGMFDSIF